MDRNRLDCKKNLKMVMPYIRNKLSQEETEEFLDHIKRCKTCREELEIYFTIEVGLNNLDEGKHDYNIAGALMEHIANSYRMLNSARIANILYYAVNTLLATGVLVTFLVQLRIWLE